MLTYESTYRHDGTYALLDVKVFDRDVTSESSRTTGDLNLHWQGGGRPISEDGEHWYAFSMLPGRSERFEQVAAFYKLARKLETKLNALRGGYGGFHSGIQPEDVLDALVALKARQVVHDNRDGEYYFLEDVPDATLIPWSDDYRALGLGSVTVRVMAHDEAEAKIKCLQEFTRLVTDKPWYVDNPADLMAQWLSAGQPVMNMAESTYGWYKAPDARTMEEMIAALPGYIKIEIEA